MPLRRTLAALTCALATGATSAQGSGQPIVDEVVLERKPTDRYASVYLLPAATVGTDTDVNVFLGALGSEALSAVRRERYFRVTLAYGKHSLCIAPAFTEADSSARTCIDFDVSEPTPLFFRRSAVVSGGSSRLRIEALPFETGRQVLQKLLLRRPE